ncbi:MAG: hypothetical protein JAY88_14710 [Candidatus Thiodiazotropha lotti]|nr:hypothetical protein [Candidatus Thiodiazotropha lotti]MCW4188315.1 hypothetical protein [Candidatus Thiodiazotropha lotti]
MIKMNQLFCLLPVLFFSTALHSADIYYFADIIHTQSEIASEAQKDNGFDDELQRRGMSTSTEIFQSQPVSRWGANVGRGYRDGRFLYEASIYADPAAEVKFKHSDFGVSHMRTDTFGGILMGGVWIGVVDIKVGLHITYQEADVHNWILNEKGVLSNEEHVALSDWSSGLAGGITVNPTDNVRAGCLYLTKVGDEDKIGTDHQLSCGVGVWFK